MDKKKSTRPATPGQVESAPAPSPVATVTIPAGIERPPSLGDVQGNHDGIDHLCQALYELEYGYTSFEHRGTNEWVRGAVLHELQKLNADQRKTIRGLLAAKKTAQAVPHQVAA